MAITLESLTIPRASAFSSSPSSPFFSSSSSSSLSSLSFSLNFPEFKGLKASSTHAVRSLSSRAKIVRRSAKIACAFHSPSSVDDKTWKSLVLESDLPVMVEFWAPWCGPCRMVQPIIDEISNEFAGKLKVFKVDTDESPTIASDNGVRSIPTVLIFKNGEKKDVIIGAVPKSTFTDRIEKFL